MVLTFSQRTSQVVCFSSHQRDPQALCRAVLPTIYRQENPHFMLYSCMPSSSYASPAFLLGLGMSVYIQANWIDIELSSPFYSTVYLYYTLKCGLFHDWAGNFFKHGFFGGFEPWLSRIKGTFCPMLYRLRYAASRVCVLFIVNDCYKVGTCWNIKLFLATPMCNTMQEKIKLIAFFKVQSRIIICKLILKFEKSWSVIHSWYASTSFFTIFLWLEKYAYSSQSADLQNFDTKNYNRDW